VGKISIGNYSWLIWFLKLNRLVALANYVENIQNQFPPEDVQTDLRKFLDL
jgi:hypothetical protein